MWNSYLDCIGKWKDTHLKFDWVAQWFPDTYECSHFLFLSLHHALLSLLQLHPWIHAQDQLEERKATLVIDTRKLSEKL